MLNKMGIYEYVLIVNNYRDVGRLLITKEG